MDDPFDLQRFVIAQHGIYGEVLDELRMGRKRSHWIWFIFPQIAGLGMSAASRKYSIRSLQEAEAYLKDPILGPRLVECARTVVELPEATADSVFGDLDAMKFRSSMTLFAHVSFADRVFHQAIERYFAGQADPRTLNLLSAQPSDS